jgi:hypothetical protein
MRKKLDNPKALAIRVGGNPEITIVTNGVKKNVIPNPCIN